MTEEEVGGGQRRVRFDLELHAFEQTGKVGFFGFTARICSITGG